MCAVEDERPLPGRRALRDEPDGLRFEQIPLGARILRVADAYASLTDARPFREAYSERQAREHLLEWTGLARAVRRMDRSLAG